MTSPEAIGQVTPAGPTMAQTGLRDVTVDGARVRVMGLGLACCALEVVEGLAGLGSPATASETAEVHVVVVGGTISRAIKPELDRLWEQVPDPKVAVAFGACTISGGPYWDSYAVLPGLRGEFGPALEVPGCPPRPDVLHHAVATAARTALAAGGRLATEGPA